MGLANFSHFVFFALVVLSSQENKLSFHKIDLIVLILSISAGADGAPRSRVCARLTPRSAPHRHQWKFFGARVLEGGG